MAMGNKFMAERVRLVTAEELERRPDDDYRYELVEGRVVRMSPVGWRHGRVVVRVCTRLSAYVEEHGLGAIVAEVGFTLRRNPDTVRGPDLAFVRRDRLPTSELRGFWEGAPDLVIEVRSPEDRPAEIRNKTAEYLRQGVGGVINIDPEDQIVSIHRPSAVPTMLDTPDAVLDLGEWVPGFHCTLAEIFQ
jgi:Uma2 family endonuclease